MKISSKYHDVSYSFSKALPRMPAVILDPLCTNHFFDPLGSSIRFPFAIVGNGNLEKIQKMAPRFIFNKYGRSTFLEVLRRRGNVQLLQVKAAMNKLKILAARLFDNRRLVRRFVCRFAWP